MTTNKKAIIIGGGITGLSVGCYIQKNGFNAEIYEMAPQPGGVTAIWKRKKYIFDGGTNWFPGSGPRLNFHSILNELLNFPNHTVINFQKFMQVRLKNGRYLDVYTNAYKLRDEMIRIAPEDLNSINKFISAVLSASKFKLPVHKSKELFTIIDYITIGFSSIPLGLFYSKWSNITIAEFSEQFSNTDLKQLFLRIFPRHSNFSVLGLIIALAWMHIESAGYPIGGSEWVISSLCKKFTNSGGILKCSTKIKKILVENNHVYGVLTEDGTIKTADITVCTCDIHSMHYDLLDGKYINEKTKLFFQDAPVFPSLIQISLGVKKDFSKYVHKIVLEYSPAIECGNDSIDVLQVRFCHFDPVFSPQGTTSIIVHLRTHDYKYWVNLRNSDKNRYNKEKKRITDQVITILENFCGPFTSHIEVIDTATPATFIRYTNIYKGSYQSWAPVPKLIGKTLNKTIPKLNGFYQCGQSIEPAGGIPRAIISARNTVQLICAQYNRKFSYND